MGIARGVRVAFGAVGNDHPIGTQPDILDGFGPPVGRVVAVGTTVVNYHDTLPIIIIPHALSQWQLVVTYENARLAVLLGAVATARPFGGNGLDWTWVWFWRPGQQAVGVTTVAIGQALIQLLLAHYWVCHDHSGRKSKNTGRVASSRFVFCVMSNCDDVPCKAPITILHLIGIKRVFPWASSRDKQVEK